MESQPSSKNSQMPYKEKAKEKKNKDKHIEEPKDIGTK